MLYATSPNRKRVRFKWGRRADNRTQQYISYKADAFHQAYVKKYPDYFESDPVLERWWYYPLGDAPKNKEDKS